MLLLFALLAVSAYESQIAAWRVQRVRDLKSDDGWLTVAGLFWLKEGKNTIGADAANDIVLPAGSAPGRAGVLEFSNGRTTMRAARGVTITAKGVPISALVMRPDSPGPADEIHIHALTLLVIKRGDRYAIRVRDKNAALRRTFKGLEWYPVSESWRVRARFIPHAQPRTLAIPNIIGITEMMASPGVAVFTVGGREHRLEPVDSDARLFFIFRDRTSGRRTYSAGRLLYSDRPKNGEVTLDFNQAYNPPCAFTPYATCPLPPKQNHLDVPVEAGELNYGDHK